MKKLFFLTSVLVVTILSCTKPSLDVIPAWGGIPPLADTISTSIDGTITSFGSNAKAQLSGNYHINIGGVNGTTNLDLDIQSPYPITTGMFIENAAAGNPIATIKYTWYDPSGWRSAVPFNSTTNPVIITITSIDATSVKGTFKGDLQFTPSSGTSIIKSIRNGVFNVKF